jgi:hypothetical protein
MEDWKSWIAHWPWLSPVLLGPLGWIGRRKGIHPWQALVRQGRLLKELESCRQDLATCEESRRNEQHATRYAMVALKEITQAAAMVKEAASEGRLTTSATSPTERENSPSRSTRSRRTRKSPLDLP